MINEENATNETETNEYNAENGQTVDAVPQTPEEYVIPTSENIPFSNEMDMSFKTLAHKLKLTSGQAREIGEWANETGMQNIRLSHETLAKIKDDSMAALKKEWGISSEKNMEKAVGTANSLSEKFPEFKEFLEETGAGNDPRFIKTLAKIGEMMSEDSLPYSKSISNKSGYVGSMPMLDFSSMENK